MIFNDSRCNYTLRMNKFLFFPDFFLRYATFFTCYVPYTIYIHSSCIKVTRPRKRQRAAKLIPILFPSYKLLNEYVRTTCREGTDRLYMFMNFIYIFIFSKQTITSVFFFSLLSFSLYTHSYHRLCVYAVYIILHTLAF